MADTTASNCGSDSSADDIAQQIREVAVMNRRAQYRKDLSPIRWNKLLSGLDVIDDTSLAISRYRAEAAGLSSEDAYLSVYGVFQDLVLQQAGCFQVVKSLFGDEWTGKPTERKQLRSIRDDRNRIAGHPVHIGDKDPDRSASYQLNRNTLNWMRPELLEATADGRTKSIVVDLDGHVRHQNRELVDELDRCLEELLRREEEHRQKFSSALLEDLLPKNAKYELGLVVESVDPFGDGRAIYTSTIVNLFCSRLEKLRCELSVRGEIGLDVDPRDFTKAEYSINELRMWLAGDSRTVIVDRQMATIFADAFRPYWYEVERMVRGIDSCYQTR